MRILLLGPNGQLGTDLRRVAAECAPDVRLIPVGRDRLDLATATADVMEAALSAESFDALVNTTGYHKTDEVETNAGLAFTVNARAVGDLAAACRRRNARFLHVSTDYVFRGDQRSPYREDDGIGPVNVYGASKAMGESLAMTRSDDVIVARVASLFGVAGASGKGGNFVETMLRLARQTGAVRVVNDVTMSPTSTADAARAMLELLRGDAGAGVYHVVNSGAATWYEFAVAIMEEAGVQATVTAVTSAEYPTAAARPAYTVLDNGRTARQVGGLPHWRDALRRYLVARGHRAA